MAQGYIQVKIDNELKNEFMEICDSIGLSATSACVIFIKKVINERKIPFELTAQRKEIARDLHSHWVVIDDCENFTAVCSNCGKVANSRSLPSVCPKCKSEMTNVQKCEDC